MTELSKAELITVLTKADLMTELSKAALMKSVQNSGNLWILGHREIRGWQEGSTTLYIKAMLNSHFLL